ncbi:tail fiber domain-containing protein [Janthinobacterium sp. LS2A]|uniref:tail fiber domain-containing protein n=1 Tax=Janthinobacterium sp. LS2A TaxID=3118590 RepID=UPI002F95E213
MSDAFYYGQRDTLYQLNRLARAQDVVDIPANSAAAAASATAAAASAKSAAGSGNTSTTSAAAAAASFISFDARYLGAKALPPTSDNAGGALLAGATYWDMALNGGCLRVRQDGQWVTVPANVASQIASTPSGTALATDVQAALNELELKKATTTSLAKVAISGNKIDVGLGNVDNTADAAKPVSAAVDSALSLKANAYNAVFGGVIGGDFSNATHDARVLLRTTTANSSTIIGAIPNGTGTVAQFNAYADDNPLNTSLAALGVVRADSVRLSSAQIGTGSYLPLKFYTGNANTMTLGINGNVSVGEQRPVVGYRYLDVVNEAGGTGNCSIIRLITKAASGGASTSADILKNSNGQFAIINYESSSAGTIYFKTSTSDATLFPGGFQVNAPGQNTVAVKSLGGYTALALDAAQGQASYIFSYNNAIEHGRVWFDNNATLGSFTIAVKRAGVLTAVLCVQGDYVYPWEDNVIGLGSFNRRWTNIYASTGVVQTSDARHKTAVVALSGNEIAAAIQLAREIGKYRFLEAVREKGTAARQHIGMTVQRAIEVMESHRLDPLAYGFICYDEWDEKTTEHPQIQVPDKVHPPVVVRHAATETAEAYDEVLTEGYTEPGEVQPARTEVQLAGSMYSFRPDELNLFIARGQAARQDQLELRLAALELAA